MSELQDDQRVRFIRQGFNLWKVQVLFRDRGLSAEEITERLARIKLELAQQSGVPDSLLEYGKLVSRRETENGLLVQMQVTRREVLSGPIVFRTHAMTAEDGTVYTDMRVTADLYPYDELDRPLTRDMIRQRLTAEGYDLSCVKWDVIDRAVAQLAAQKGSMRGLTIAEGRFPEAGTPSRVTYNVSEGQEEFLASAWMGIRPVRTGELLVEVSTATSGHKGGVNVFGRSLPPPPPRQTRLIAEEGTRLGVRNTQLLALCDGILLLERAGMDRRQKDSFDLQPLTVRGRVVGVRGLRISSGERLQLSEAAMVGGDVPPGACITSTSALYVEGNVCEGAQIECRLGMRIVGHVHGATVRSKRHVCIHGNVERADIRAALTLQIEGQVSESILRATDLIVRDKADARVDATRQIELRQAGDRAGAAVVRYDLRKLLETEHAAGREALLETQRLLNRITDIFGPEIALQTTEGTVQRMLMKWLREQKLLNRGNFTHTEVEEFRTILGMIPQLRAQLAAIGLELRDVGSKLEQEKKSCVTDSG